MDRVCLLLVQAPLADPEIQTRAGATAVPVILGVLFGAFAGLLAGIILSRLIHFAVYLAGRGYEGRGLIVLCTLCGAAAGVWLALTR